MTLGSVAARWTPAAGLPGVVARVPGALRVGPAWPVVVPAASPAAVLGPVGAPAEPVAVALGVAGVRTDFVAAR